MLSDTCMRCPYNSPRRAKHTRLWAIGENTFRTRLCDKHAQVFDRDQNAWVMYADVIPLDKPVGATVRPPTSREFGDDSARLILRLKERAAAKGVGRTENLDDGTEVLIGPHADEWRFTRHAQERAEQRGFTAKEVLQAAAYPETTAQNIHGDVGTYYYVAGECALVVNPKEKHIITVYNRFEYLMNVSAQEKGIA